MSSLPFNSKACMHTIFYGLLSLEEEIMEVKSQQSCSTALKIGSPF